jgi:hypothetical protein
MTKITYRDSRNFEYDLSDELIINFDNYEYSTKAYLIHDAGFPICIVFASEEHEAIDIAVDAGKLEAYKLTLKEELEYKQDGIESSITYCGDDVTPMDLDSLTIIELPHPKRLSYCKTIKEIRN